MSAGEKSAIAEGSEVSTIAESRKASTSLARDAAGKLLAAGAAAVGAYFTILKFVGGEPAEGWSLLIGVLPAVGYLVVCLLAAVALRPVLMRVYGPTDFEQKLDKRLIQLNGLLSATVALFVLSTALSVVAYLTLWP